jgi:hypothetical protein
MDIKELHSFKLSDAVKFHDRLNPKLWIGEHLDPQVRKQLLVIAKDFMTELGIHTPAVDDITISGSNAAYSYTPHSDLDLHILVDMSKLLDNDVYKELFHAKKTLYNDSHDITIRGVPVELYIQDSNEPVVSLGEYSILNDRWIKRPTKRRANLDQNATRAKFDKLLEMVTLALKTKDLKKLTKVIKNIKRYRQAGLDKGGEFSPENLAYKALRSQGLIEKLYKLRDKLHSELLSIDEMYRDPVKIQKKSRVTESAEQKLTLGQLYDDLPDHDEMIWNYVGHNDFDIPFTVETISPRKLSMYLLSQYHAEHIDDITDMLEPEQQEIVDNYVNDPNLSKKIIVMANGKIIDGHHRALAAVISNRPIKYVDVAEDNEEDLNEAFDQPYQLKWDNGEFGDYDAYTQLPDGSSLSIMFNREDDDVFTVEFWRSNSQDVTGEGDSQKIFATVLSAIQEFLTKEQPRFISFTGAKGEQETNKDSRVSLYSKLLQRYASRWGYRLKNVHDSGDSVTFDLVRIKHDVSEASGYIPTYAQRNDPRFEKALTVDVHPDTMKKGAKKFGWKISRAGIPPTANPNGKF